MLPIYPTIRRAPLRDKDVKRGMRKRDVNDDFLDMESILNGNEMGALTKGPISGWIHLPNLSGSMSQQVGGLSKKTHSINRLTPEREKA
jgi:hypothetical protein